MQSVLVAVDGSPHSIEGVKSACMVAKALQAKIELVYVIAPILLAPSAYAETIATLEQGNRALAEEILNKAKAVVLENGVSDVELVTLTGAPAEALADLALAQRVWGVVIGAKGHSAISRVFLGSVTDRLVHICSKPVLVVR
jgi:nucleotide-binding universal stress UspA family protein